MLCFLSMSSYLMAQETVRKKEIGLVFSSLNDFGLTFRTGTAKSLWRFNTLLLYGGKTVETADSLIRTQSHTGFSVKIGKEYRKELADNLELRFGGEISFAYSRYRVDRDDKTIYNDDRVDQRINYSPGVNLVFGFNYLLSDNFLIGAEVLPNFTYTTGTSIEIDSGIAVESDVSGFSYGLSNTSALMSLVYRF